MYNNTIIYKYLTITYWEVLGVGICTIIYKYLTITYWEVLGAGNVYTGARNNLPAD